MDKEKDFKFFIRNLLDVQSNIEMRKVLQVFPQTIPKIAELLVRYDYTSTTHVYGDIQPILEEFLRDHVDLPLIPTTQGFMIDVLEHHYEAITSLAAVHVGDFKELFNMVPWYSEEGIDLTLELSDIVVD